MPSDIAPATQRKATLLAWLLNVPFVAVVGLLYWYDRPMQMQVVCGLGLTASMAYQLWRHYGRGVPQQYIGVTWFAFACGVSGTAFTIKAIMAQGI